MAPARLEETSTFEFINLSKPKGNLDPATRRLVRRNATLHRSRNRKTPTKSKKEVIRPEKQCSPRIGVRLQLFPTGMQQYMYDLIEYSDKVMFPSIFPLRDIYQLHPGHRMTMCLTFQDARVRNSQLALAALRYSRETCDSDDSRSFVVTGLKHQQEALGLVKDWLAASSGANIDPGAAICISALASIEIILQNAAGWQAHIEALKKLAENSHATHSIGLAQHAIIDTELCGCYFFNKRPSFLQDDDLDSFREVTSKDHESRRVLLVALSGTHKSFFVDNSVLECVLKLQDLTRMINPESEVAHPELYIRLYVSTRTAIEYKLFQLLEDNKTSPFSRIVCLAAQIYANRVPRTFQRGSLYVHRLAERLKEAMDSVLNTSMTKKHLPASVLWVAVMGALGAQDGPIRAWFLDWIALACLSTRIKTQLDAQVVLNSWLWSSPALNDDAMAVWEELESMNISNGGALLASLDLPS